VVPDEPERYDLGQGAGFYVNATHTPYADNYHMYDYVTKELPALVEAQLPLLPGVKSVTGHSMGGHGALICALKEPDAYRSVSAFAPICNPVNCGWGKGCFTAYLGEDQSSWAAYDATELVKGGARVPHLLIDSGLADEFYDEGQLLPENLKAACEAAGQPLALRLQEGYDHSYHFIATFIGEHIAYHAERLKAV
jgi:S-formylglutathione hydrolase